jgi:hypothetical protein
MDRAKLARAVRRHGLDALRPCEASQAQQGDDGKCLGVLHKVAVRRDCLATVLALRPARPPLTPSQFKTSSSIL